MKLTPPRLVLLARRLASVPVATRRFLRGDTPLRGTARAQAGLGVADAALGRTLAALRVAPGWDLGTTVGGR